MWAAKCKSTGLRRHIVASSIVLDSSTLDVAHKPTGRARSVRPSTKGQRSALDTPTGRRDNALPTEGDTQCRPGDLDAAKGKPAPTQLLTNHKSSQHHDHITAAIFMLT